MLGQLHHCLHTGQTYDPLKAFPQPTFATTNPTAAAAAGRRPHQYERALHIGEAALGPDHPDIGIWRNNRGRVLHDLGDLAAARTQCERALQIGEAALGPDHPNIGIWRNNLGRVLHDLGDLAGARTQCERALQTFERVYGSDDERVIELRRNLAELDQEPQ